MAWHSWVSWWYSWGSFLVAAIPGKEVDINSKTPTPGCSLIMDYFREGFSSLFLQCDGSLEWNSSPATAQNKWRSHPMVILVTDGVGEGNLGMGTTFCHHNQAKARGFWCTFWPTSTWLTRAKCVCREEVQQNSYIPWGPFPSLLSRCEHTLCGCFLCPISTGLATSMYIAPLLWHWGGLASRRGRDGIESVSPIPRGSMSKLRRGALPLWSDFIVNPFVSPSSTLRRGHPDRGKLGFQPALKFLQDANQARAQLECELAQETEELAQRYENKWIKQARRHERWWAWMVK